MGLPGLFSLLDYGGVAVFAATGALAAARKGQTLVTFGFFAAVTGVGGGTLRDLLLGVPVFWVNDPGYISVSLAVAGLIWAMGGRFAAGRALVWLDAAGLAAYACLGAAKAASTGAPPLICIVMGVLSASFGGVVRDVLAGQPSILLNREIYISAAALGAFAYVAARLIGLPLDAAFIIGAASAFGLRGGAIAFKWSLPVFDAKA